MRIAIVGGVAALVLAATVSSGAGDIRPPDPARKACMGLADGAPCTLDGKAGSCHGPHPSRMTCQPGQPSSQGPGDAAAGSGVGSAAGSATSAAGSATGSAAGSATGGDAVDHAPSNPEPAAAPGHKRGCAVATPGSAALVGLAVAALAVRRRRGRRSMP